MKAIQTKTENIIWFNPPYNNIIKTKIGKLTDKQTPNTSKLLKKNTIKNSYSCMDNIEK